MAFNATTQVLENGPRNLVIKFTGFSTDGTGESGVKKVDAQSSTYANEGQVPGTHLTVTELEYDVEGMTLLMSWEGSPSNADMHYLGQNFGFKNFDDIGGLHSPSGLAGSTGSILFTTIGTATNSSYTVTMTMKKNVPSTA